MPKFIHSKKLAMVLHFHYVEINLYIFQLLSIIFIVLAVLGTIRNLAIDPTSALMLCKHNGIKAMGQLLREDVYEPLIHDTETKEKVLIEVCDVLHWMNIIYYYVLYISFYLQIFLLNPVSPGYRSFAQFIGC
jgi:hypothetical protein